MSDKDPVKLRRRKTTTGHISLYLDIYYQGQRCREGLKLYLAPEKTRADKERNKETLALADAIRAKRLVEVRNRTYGFRANSRAASLFVDYFNKAADERCTTAPLRKAYGYVLRRWVDFAGERMTFEKITPEIVRRFFHHLSGTTNNHNTLWLYWSKFCTIFNAAVRDGVIDRSPCIGIVCRKKSTERVYLTLEEVRALAATECKFPVYKRAFLFSCLTGLRRSDIQALTWGQVQEMGGFTRLVFRQQKTKKNEYYDISPEAVQWMGARGRSTDRVFKGFEISGYYANAFRECVKAAGIDKYVTFHCARHTFAVLMLTLGVELYTVSKLLGHADIKTTQIYAHIVDRTKQEAVMKIPKILEK